MAPKKKRSSKDPHAKREARRYAKPIVSREYIASVVKMQKGPCKFNKLAKLLELNEPSEQNALERRLSAMVRDGQLEFNHHKGYLPVSERDLIRGRVIANPDGFGFLHPEEGGDDLFISPKQMRSLLHGDRVVMRVTGVDRRGRREASLIEVVERANKQVVGRLFHEGQITFVVADNKRIHQDILIPKEHQGVAREGQIVLTEITEDPSQHHQPIGRIVQVLGEHMAPGMEIDIAVNSFGLPHEWSSEVQSEASTFGAEVLEKDKLKRLDLREKPLVTIDGEDAKDFDDAVFCERINSGWRLYVAIADVSHYVKQNSALDQEAFNRGTSVYFPGRVIPMLPEHLSNGLCSLKPQVDRLCMVCILEFGPDGSMQGFEFAEGVMCSQARLTYDEVSEILLGSADDKTQKYYETLIPHLKCLHELYKALHAQREKRGAIDLETTEANIIFGENKKIDSIVPVTRNDAHRLIEECMIAANIAAARFLNKHKILGLFRVHESPPVDKIEDLISFLGELGISFPKSKQVKAQHYATLLKTIKGRADSHLIQTVMLRSLSQAEYHLHNRGHFGLALKEYAHFTSPIRRYPDLLVHRAIRHILRGGTADNYPYTQTQMLDAGEHSSMAERRADEASRDAVEWLKCEYMLDKVNETYSGIISGVTSFGFFVELQDIFVEGLVHITSLPKDYYRLDPVAHKLNGERTGRTFQLADSVKVTVSRVSLDDRQIDFELDESSGADRSNKRRKRR